MSESENNIKAYIQQVLKIQEERSQNPLSEAEMHKIAEDLGLSPQDLAFIENKYKDYLTRGLGYSRYEDWQSAAEEFKQAVSLKPNSAEALYGLALAYKHLARQKRDKELLNKAKHYVKRTLQVNPNHELAYKLSAELNKGLGGLTNTNPFSTTKPLWANDRKPSWLHNDKSSLAGIRLDTLNEINQLFTLQEEKRLARSNRDRKISGVCSGIAEYFGIDPTWIRIAFLIGAFFFGGITIPLYIILSFILPKK
ncbi:MAG: PspC domain-containing protein [Microscillaceae bacterium]|nr:PspC domain-containing protein [Microscillaceae bacterium]MDW8459810.1 PspC domain-containing protein [Cytophagales bacterium]